MILNSGSDTFSSSLCLLPEGLKWAHFPCPSILKSLALQKKGVELSTAPADPPPVLPQPA